MHEEVDYSEKLVFSDEEGNNTNNNEKASRSTPSSRSSKADSGKNFDDVSCLHASCDAYRCIFILV